MFYACTLGWFVLTLGWYCAVSELDPTIHPLLHGTEAVCGVHQEPTQRQWPLQDFCHGQCCIIPSVHTACRLWWQGSVCSQATFSSARHHTDAKAGGCGRVQLHMCITIWTPYNTAYRSMSLPLIGFQHWLLIMYYKSRTLWQPSYVTSRER